MPSIKTTTPIIGGKYYHLFNRGVNRHELFYKPKNYIYFLSLLKKFLTGYIDVLENCLLPNHFHLVVKVKDEISFSTIQKPSTPSERNKVIIKIIRDEEEIGKLVIKQLKRLFITYAMAINNQEKRVGNLFAPKYKRLEVTSEDYLNYHAFVSKEKKDGFLDE